ncbi:MFS transporter [Actinomadura parmotrematis]|uniref:MFS transporter n=1 Tax=Actinomadura parmotrematis TaxID=2864039 RepID=A0ABS7FY18_9ACTN|nr:MFS transporter [Actinomadura parmotrematis]MBW8485323.1 MFS transporter [Actinomadura parmotrematis]
MTALVTPGTAVRRFGPRHRWTVLAVGVGAQASFAAMFSGLPVTGVLLRADYGLTTGALGLVLGCLGLGVAASDLVWGMLTDRFGDRNILLTGLSATGVLLAAMAAAATPGAGAGTAALAACLFAAGALGGSVNGASGRAVMTWFADDRRGLAMSIRQTAIPAGGAVGVAVLPPIAGTWGFGAAYATLAAFCLLSVGAVARWLHEPDRAAGTVAPTAAGPSPLRRPDVWRVVLAAALLTVPQMAVLSFTAVFLHDARGAGGAVAAGVVLVAQIGGGAARIWSGRRTDRGADRRTFMRAIGVLTAVAMAGAAVLADAPLPLTAAALAAGGLLANAWHGVAYTEAAVLAGPDRAGAALGLAGTTIFSAAFVTPLALPVLLDATSWPAVWAAAALAPLLAVPLTPRAARRA